MSFSYQVKKELSEHIANARHCQLAELAAYIQFFGNITDEKKLVISGENELIGQKCFTLLQKTFNIVTIEDLSKGDLSHEILKCIGLMDGDRIKPVGSGVAHKLLKNSCCRRAYIRGVFLAAGSITNPEKAYHLELVCQNEEQAESIRQVLAGFDIDARMITRKNDYVLYIKDSDTIALFLGICEAHVALMELENTRIYKDVRNDVNRRVNCETANIAKTISAAARQNEDIRIIEQKLGLGALPKGLMDIAVLRLENPDATLTELGNMLDPPVGKSGVNHRLRRLGEIAREL